MAEHVVNDVIASAPRRSWRFQAILTACGQERQGLRTEGASAWSLRGTSNVTVPV